LAAQRTPASHSSCLNVLEGQRLIAVLLIYGPLGAKLQFEAI